MLLRFFRLVYMCFFAGAFLYFFIFPYGDDWVGRYSLFKVHAFSHPGGDSRNIQMAAHCNKVSNENIYRSSCVVEGEPVKLIYPGAKIPPFNYPRVWADIYSVADLKGEEGFRIFWTANAVAFMLGVFLLSLRYNAFLFPLLIFSPVSLLTIERGNIEALTFSFLFICLLFLSRSSLRAFVLGVAGSLKVFPLIGLSFFFQKRFPFLEKGAFWGVLISSPILIYSLWDIQEIVGNTTSGFAASYGLLSIKNFEHYDKPWLFLCAYSICVVLLVMFLIKRVDYKIQLHNDLGKLGSTDRLLLSVSLLIFFATFLVFTNWAYRLIFLIPAVLIVSRMNCVLLKVLYFNSLFVFASPFLPYGWFILNLACYALAPQVGLVIYSLLSLQFSGPSKSIESLGGCAGDS